jgi:Helix-turn-helix domain
MGDTAGLSGPKGRCTLTRRRDRWRTSRFCVIGVAELVGLDLAISSRRGCDTMDFLVEAPSQANAGDRLSAADALGGAVLSSDGQSETTGYERRVLGGTEPSAKWGNALAAGYQVLPDTILRHWSRHGLLPGDLVVLLHLTMAWWKHDEKPFPRPTTIARRMGVSLRTVQRSIRRLGQVGFIQAEPVQVKGAQRRAFDLSGIAAMALVWAKEDLAFRWSSWRAPQSRPGHPQASQRRAIRPPRDRPTRC